MRPPIETPPEFGCLAGGVTQEVAEAEIRTALAEQAGRIGARVLPGVGTFFVFAALYDAVTGDPRTRVPIVAATCLCALALVAIGRALQRGARVPGGAHGGLSMAGAMVLLQAVVRLLYTPPALPTVHILLLVVVLSSMLLGWGWFTLTIGGSLAAWGLLAWQIFAPAERLVAVAGSWTLALVTLAAMFIHHRRLENYRRRIREHIVEARNREGFHRIQTRYESAVRGANDGLWFWDLASGEIYVSARWSQMAGSPGSASSLSPEQWWDTVDLYHLEGFRAAVDAHLAGETEQLEYKHRLRRRDGSSIWVLTKGLATRDGKGTAISIAGSMTDISHVVEIEQALVRDALHDRLTGLANRHCLTTELQRAMEQSRETGSLIALVFIDLDDFKLVNDNLGHLAGDQLLIEVATRLRSCTRPHDLLSRYGGDEFVLLMEGLSDASEAEMVGRRIQEVLAAPAGTHGHSLKVTAGVGIAVNHPAVWQPDELLRNADIAMYEAKAQGKNQLGVFSPEMHSRARHSWALYNAVRDVVDREECALNYQPIVSVEDGCVAGMEALFRWNAPQAQKTNTGEFILAAEKTGAIIEIGQWALRRACADAAGWQRQGLRPIPVSVNVSAHQARLPGFWQTVERVLEEEGLDPRWLELELTETAFMEDLDIVCANLRELVDMGVRLAVDDFGTGYSNLGYLTKFPLRSLKIDGSFVINITSCPQTAALTKGLISLAHSLGIEVTAERVENLQQLRFLAAESCDRVQGYLVSPPLPEREAARLLASEDTLLPLTAALARPPRRPARRDSWDPVWELQIGGGGRVAAS
jgi:diguanylate cyclase (GGDEF)-like protein/PAS domain S-box-containing protein